MTEEEAKTRWCPFARFAIDAAGFTAANRYEEGSFAAAHCRCLGSACMAWRWDFLRAFRGTDVDPDEGVVWTSDRGKYSTTSGHCGLAGKP